MLVQLITPEKILLEGEATMVTAPGGDGDFGVLPGHMNFISTLRPGTVTVELASGEKHEVAVASGFAEVTAERATFLIEAA